MYSKEQSNSLSCGESRMLRLKLNVLTSLLQINIPKMSTSKENKPVPKK